MPRVSVVVPAFRSADFVVDTIKSVLAQTYTDFELVLADHSSDDDTQAVLERFGDTPRVRVLSPTPPGGGAEANWNRASRAATGEFLKLLPADDLLRPDALERQVDALERHPSAVLVASRRRLIDATGRTLLAKRGLPGSLLGLHTGAEAIRVTVRAGTNVFGEPGAVLLRRDALARAGWWDGRSGYAIDLQTYANVLAHGDMVGIDHALSSFRISGQQWSVRLASSQAAEMAAVFERLGAQFGATVSPSDVRLGSRRAWVQSLARRGVYLALGLSRRSLRGG